MAQGGREERRRIGGLRVGLLLGVDGHDTVVPPLRDTVGTRVMLLFIVFLRQTLYMCFHCRGPSLTNLPLPTGPRGAKSPKAQLSSMVPTSARPLGHRSPLDHFERVLRCPDLGACQFRGSHHGTVCVRRTLGRGVKSDRAC